MTRPSITASDPRFSLRLLSDVRHVLQQHGYVPSQNPTAHSKFMVDLLQLVNDYEDRS